MARIPADQRRQDLIEAAVRVISEHGVSGATTRRIADAANAPLATLHYCFHTKELLFLAVFQHQVDQLAAHIVSTEVPVGLGRAASNTLAGTVDWFTQHEDYARAQYDLILWAQRQDGDNAALAANVYELFYEKFSAVLQGALQPADSPDLVLPLSRLLIALIDGLILNWVSNRDPEILKADLDLASESIELLVASRRRRRR